MNIFIRADASVRIGTGHVMRCLTLADALNKNGAEIYFVCREETGNLIDLIKKKRYVVFPLAPDIDWKTDGILTGEIINRQAGQPDWLIIDHYSIDQGWETPQRKATRKIMVIDDLANRCHDCDILLNQNYSQDMASRYDNLVSVYCKKLLGPAFALLRTEFIEVRKNLRTRDGSVKNILVFFGGSDPTSETEKALEAIRLLGRRDIFIDVIVGISNQKKDYIRALCSTLPNIRYHCQIDNMAEMLNYTDLAIGAGGATTWERCCLSVPSLIVSVAENQVEIAQFAAAAGAALYLGPSDSVTAFDITKQLQLLIQEPAILLKLSQGGSRLVDGQGVERVSSALRAA